MTQTSDLRILTILCMVFLLIGCTNTNIDKSICPEIDEVCQKDFIRMCDLTCPELGYIHQEWYCEDHDCYCEDENKVNGLRHCHYFFKD